MSNQNFLDRVADVSGDSARMLQEVANLMRRLGHYRTAIRCEELADQNRRLQFDCLVETQPIND